MKPKEFIDQVDDAKVLAAISSAEQKSSGEIRLYVSNGRVDNALSAAQIQFARLGMENTRLRNGVLLFFAPKSQQFAIVGDSAIHEKCGNDYWQEISNEMSALLKGGQFTQAIVQAINRVGDALAKHFPRAPEDRNELPDGIVRD